MGTVAKRTVREALPGFLALCHPLPVFFHAVAVSIFALLAGWPHIAWGAFVLVVLAHSAMQLAIAVHNDYCDRYLDAQSKRSKPIVRGLVRPREALLLSIVFIVLMFMLLLPLNPLALLISVLYLLFALGYNLGLKSTPLSGIVFALAIPLIPVYAFVGMGRIVPFIFWFIPVAALVGIALNLANSLPDLEDDAAHHARTLAVVLGMRATLFLIPLLIFCGVCIIVVLSVTHLVVTRFWIIFPALIVVGALLGSLFIFFSPPIAPSRRKSYFNLVVVTCLVLGAGWLISILA